MGFLTRIDVQSKFCEKLNIDYLKYVILGVCSPNNAYKAIGAESDIGLFLLCNIIIYEKDGKTIFSVI